MRILLVNKYNYPRGGADTYFLFLQAALTALGHEVAIFAMDHPRNYPSPWQKYFVSRISFNQKGIIGKIRAAGRIFYSFEAARKFGQLVDDFRPDIVHCHNIYHQLSPSILGVAKKRGIPVILHLHDYKLISPNYRLFARGKIWRASLDEKSYWAGVRDNCLESYPRSLLTYLEMVFHHKIGRFYERNVDRLIAPSQFMAKLVSENGWADDKIYTLANCVPVLEELKPAGPTSIRQPLLYFGRLSEEKGIEDLIRASKMCGTDLQIIGSGPIKEKLTKLAKSASGEGRTTFLGQIDGPALLDQIAKAGAVVIPSRWYENMPLALLEALALGKIVIASRIGGLPEVVKNGQNGFLFEPGNVADLGAKIKLVNNLSPEQAENIRQEALLSASQLSSKNYLKQLVNLYLELVNRREKA